MDARLVAALIIAAFTAGLLVARWTKDFVSFAQVISDFGTVAAIVVGGAWTYYSFFKGRVFVPRLQAELTARQVCFGEHQYVLASMKLKNLGLRQAEISKAGTALVLESLGSDPPKHAIYGQDWRDPRAFAVLANHSHIEPGLTITEEALIAVPFAQSTAYRVQFIVVAHTSAWGATAIAIGGRDSGTERGEDHAA